MPTTTTTTRASVPRNRQRKHRSDSLLVDPPSFRSATAVVVPGDEDGLQEEWGEKKYLYPRSGSLYLFRRNCKLIVSTVFVAMCLYRWHHTSITADPKKWLDSVVDDLWSEIQPQACTFQQLYDAFPPAVARRRRNTTTTTQTTTNRACWKLQEEIVRISANTIVNRNHLQSLGNGAISGVYRAILQIPNNNHNKTFLCSAAIKTDHCHSGWPFWLKYQRSRSCVETNSYLWAPRSYMGAEYTGALVWYAQYQQNQSIPGLIPTWAIIVRDESEATIATPLFRWQRRRQLDRYPHPDPSVLGVLMPLVHIQTASDLIEKYQSSSVSAGRLWNTSQQLARALLPAAQGLAFVGSMGLAFRDLLPKNVGFLTSTGEAVVYDHSYMGVKHREDCHHVSCQFCPEENVFPKFDDRLHREIKQIPAGHDYILGDLHNFRKVIATLCTTTCLDAPQAKNMARDVSQVQTIHALIQVLQSYATAA